MIYLKKIINSILLSLVSVSYCLAQENAPTLSADEVLLIVRKFHPVVKIAAAQIQKSEADILVAKGGFDPSLANYIGGKTLNGEYYYSGIAPEVKIPTWYGIDVIAGVDNMNGNRIDPSETDGTYSYIGANLPILKGLMMDKRRAFLLQAKEFNKMAYTEQRKIINDICYEAISLYWQWVYEYESYKILQNAVSVNRQRLQLVRRGMQLGERPSIDTVESLSQLQSFEYLQNQKLMNAQNAAIQLSAYLWTNNNAPYTLPTQVLPQDNWDTSYLTQRANFNFDYLSSAAATNHPELVIYQQKSNILNIDLRLKKQDLLPKLDLNYNLLTKGLFNPVNYVKSGGPFQNSQYGIKFGMPFNFWEGRGLYRGAKIKIDQNDLDFKFKQQIINTKIKRYLNEYETLRNQINLLRDNLNNYNALVRAEELRFTNGESSVFLINSRENKALEAQEKLLETKIKFIKSMYSLQWSAGML
jgi:outer membrane protein TolC